MITTETMSDRIEVRAFGPFTLADCREFEEQSDYRIRFNGPIDLLVDLRDMTGCSLDALVEELRYLRRHRGDFSRIAVVTRDEWVTWNAWLTQWMIDGELQVFADEDEAVAWLYAESAATGPVADLSDGQIQ